MSSEQQGKQAAGAQAGTRALEAASAIEQKRLSLNRCGWVEVDGRDEE